MFGLTHSSSFVPRRIKKNPFSSLFYEKKKKQEEEEERESIFRVCNGLLFSPLGYQLLCDHLGLGVPKAMKKEEAADTEEEVKTLAKDQRAALPGEPTCAICGRYGEYVCDETDDDVCSLECKAALLATPSRRLPATDECFYVRDHPAPSSLSNYQTQLLRNRLDINVGGDGVPPPVLSFSSCDLPPKLLRNIELASYDMPTPVQMQAIPAALTGRSLLVSADTGSGKTASFLIPIISLCVSVRGRCTSEEDIDCKAPLAMVLTPTRELCVQVEDNAKLLAKGLPFKTALVVGGDAMAGQIYRMRQGVEMIVGTPGRLIDLLTKHDVELDDVRVLVLDEVDCILERGFREQVWQLFRALSRPQVLMYSATISPELENMARSMAKEIVSISVGQPNKPNKAVKQLAIWVDSKHKKQKLFDILTSKQHFMPPAVVYVGSRLGADLLCNAIMVTTGLKALSIHGEKPMKERRETMRSFLVGEVPVIVSTGVLGRGVDLVGVRQVIVFDMPNSMKEYVHQIGRASRMGEEGTAMVFVNEENKNIIPEFIEVLKSAGAALPRELVNSRYSVATPPVGKGNRKRRYGS